MTAPLSLPPSGLHVVPPDWFDRVCFVLLFPSHPGNVGSAARAMRVMGFKHLRVVAPRFVNVAQHADAIAFASGASDVLSNLKEYSGVDEALADVTFKVAISATSREFCIAAQPPEPICTEISALLQADALQTVALVFGTERTGMSIEQVQRCQRVCSIPGSLDYQSLNLAQAVQIISYCLARSAERHLGQPISKDPGEQPAADADTQAMLLHLQKTLIDIGFLDPEKPKKLMPRLQRLAHKADLKRSEVDVIRGLLTAITRAKNGR
jgi:tRNA/rRNA methyltransferase